MTNATHELCRIVNGLVAEIERSRAERDALAAALTTMGVDPASIIAALTKP